MSLEALDPRTKREWFEALSLLCKYRNVVSSRGFTRHVMDEQVGLQNNFEKESLLRQQREPKQQQQQQSLLSARNGSEAPESGSKWEVRRKAREREAKRFTLPGASVRGRSKCFSVIILRNVVDSIQAINGQNADKIIGLRVLNSLKTHKQS